MPLDLREVQTELMVLELGRRYAHLVLIGVAEGYAGPDTMTEMSFYQGSPLIGLGLLKIAEDEIMDEWHEGKSDSEDTP